MTLLGKKKILQVSIETDKGELVAGATDVLAYDPVINPDDTYFAREATMKTLSQTAGIVGERTGTCTFRAELRGDGTDALDGGLEILLQACGYSLTTKVYSPESSIATQETITIDVYEDGLRKRLFGAMGNVNLAGEFGKPMFCEFEFRGVWAAPVDAGLPTVSANAAVPMRAAGATFTIGSWEAKVANLSVNLNAEVVAREDIASAAGVEYFLISGRDPQISMDAEAELVATEDSYGLWLAGTPAAFSCLLTDGTVNVTIAAPKLLNRQVSEGDRDGKLLHEIVAQATVNAANVGDDELTITTAAAGA